MKVTIRTVYDFTVWHRNYSTTKKHILLLLFFPSYKIKIHWQLLEILLDRQTQC